jgi:hypothetical protein
MVRVSLIADLGLEDLILNNSDRTMLILELAPALRGGRYFELLVYQSR